MLLVVSQDGLYPQHPADSPSLGLPFIPSILGSDFQLSRVTFDKVYTSTVQQFFDLGQIGHIDVSTSVQQHVGWSRPSNHLRRRSCAKPGNVIKAKKAHEKNPSGWIDCGKLSLEEQKGTDRPCLKIAAVTQECEQSL